MFIQVSGKCGQKHEIIDKNMKLWTKTRNYGQAFRVYLWTFKWTQKVYFMFLSTFSRKLYEHLNMFIRIGYVSWHLCNYFIIFYLNQPKSLQNQKTQILLFPISTKINQTLKKIIKPNKTFNFYYFQTLTKSSKPSQIQSNPNFKHQNFVISKPK